MKVQALLALTALAAFGAKFHAMIGHFDGR
jgi:hypothetical protein